jgi:hypothetical protein
MLERGGALLLDKPPKLPSFAFFFVHAHTSKIDSILFTSPCCIEYYRYMLKPSHPLTCVLDISLFLSLCYRPTISTKSSVSRWSLNYKLRI